MEATFRDFIFGNRREIFSRNSFTISTRHLSKPLFKATGFAPAGDVLHAFAHDCLRQNGLRCVLPSPTSSLVFAGNFLHKFNTCVFKTCLPVQPL